MIKPKEQVLLGMRVPAYLKERLTTYCASHGVKMNYFVAEAIAEKLLEIAEDKKDLETAQKRLRGANFISQKEFNKYLLKRRIRS